jgi:hypothetical protein
MKKVMFCGPGATVAQPASTAMPAAASIVLLVIVFIVVFSPVGVPV